MLPVFYRYKTHLFAWFSCDIDWDSIEDVREHGEKYLEINKKNGYTYYYENVFGHYAKPVRFR